MIPFKVHATEYYYNLFDLDSVVRKLDGLLNYTDYLNAPISRKYRMQSLYKLLMIVPSSNKYEQPGFFEGVEYCRGTTRRTRYFL